MTDANIKDVREIVTANEGDLDIITELNQQLHLGIEGFKWDKSEWIKNEIENGNYFVLKQHNQVAGAINVKKSGGNELYIETIVVDPNKHNSGIGKQLITFAKDLARKLGCNKITIESFQSYGVQEFYQKVGFMLDDPSVGYYGGESFHRFVMYL